MTIFRQLFDAESSTYTYLIGDQGQALIIDPVLEQRQAYRQLAEELGLDICYALDTHIHADHITALGALRDETGCVTVMGEQSEADCVSTRLGDGDSLSMAGITIRALFTPGHTRESYSYVWENGPVPAVFTGDTLLIRGSGRTDFQGGDPGQSWDSIQRLFQLPDHTRVYPAHDYKGWTLSTIGEEKQHNPRLAGKSREDYIDIMENLDLDDPKMMDIAVPANKHCGNTPFDS